MTRTSLAVLLVAALVQFIVAVPAAQAGDGAAGVVRVGSGSVTGSGRLQTETRAVGAFQAIATRGSIDVVLRQRERESVELRADDNILPLIEARVVDRGGVPTLEIGPKDGTSTSSRHPLVATIGFVTLRALALAGSGQLRCDALKAPALQVAADGSSEIKLLGLDVGRLALGLSGSGEVELGGRAAALALKIAGSASVNAATLAADDVSVSVAGSGDAVVNARRALNVSLSGSGSVAYRGDAAVNAAVSGSGRVKKL